MGIVKGKVENLENDMGIVKGKVENLENDMGIVKGKVENLENDMGIVKDKVDVLEEQTRIVDSRLVRLEIIHETDVVPRLRSIESCYTDTYKRYQKSISDHEGMKQDIAIIKKVVTEHSIQLEQIS